MLGGLAGYAFYQKSEAETQRQLANEERQTAQRQLVAVTLKSGRARLDAGDTTEALPWYLLALSQDQNEAERAAIHRMRVSTTLRHCPPLLQFFDEARGAVFHPKAEVLAVVEKDHVVLNDPRTGTPIVPPLAHESVWGATTPESFRYCGLAHAGLGQWAKAIEDHQNAVARLDTEGWVLLQMADADYLIDLAIAHAKAGQRAEALKTLNKRSQCLCPFASSVRRIRRCLERHDRFPRTGTGKH
jgi:tetratricopeptide (TPR) repeat protein